mmetsp:Transcript_35001/g.110607  ORF Transcript_35001/g.110607 Transcript_35001/m.110607 type:complete len:128 (+) Transcript_35001:563-946(+)
MVKAALTEMREKMQRRPGDVGSTEVQVGALTARISFMTEHLIKHKKDNHSRRGLVLMLEQRKKLLKYFRKKNPAGYDKLLLDLNLKDPFANSGLRKDYSSFPAKSKKSKSAKAKRAKAAKATRAGRR